MSYIPASGQRTGKARVSIAADITCEATIRHVLLVLCPGDLFVLEQVDDREHITRIGIEVVRIVSKVVTSYRGDVVGFAGVLEGVSKVCNLWSC